jgi:hypothetical protein
MTDASTISVPRLAPDITLTSSSGATMGDQSTILTESGPLDFTARRSARTLLRAATIATMLPFARLDDISSRGSLRPGTVGHYLVLVDEEQDVRLLLLPIFRFTLGASRIEPPRRVQLDRDVLERLGVGQRIIRPIAADFEEM